MPCCQLHRHVWSAALVNFWSWETNSCCKVGSPTIPGKFFHQQQFDIPRINLRHHLDCSGRLHPIWCPNAVATRANSTAEDSQKDAFLTSALSADAAHVLLSTTLPNLLSPWCHWSAKLAPHTQLIRRLPVEPWPEPIDRGRCMRYQPCQAVMSLRDSPPKPHLCAVPQGTNLRLELFDCPFRKPIPWALSLLTCSRTDSSSGTSATMVIARAALTCANNAGSPSLGTITRV